MKKPVSIRNAMLVSVSQLALLPLLVAVLLAVVLFHRETTERIRKENLRVAQTVGTAVELFLARPVVMLKQLRDAAEDHCDATCSNLLTLTDGVLAADPIFESATFYGADGSVVGTAGGVVGNKSGSFKAGLAGSEIFKLVKQSGKTVWSEPYVSLRTGESVISVGIPWRGGAVSGTMNLSYLSRLVEPTKTSHESYAFIVSPAGQLIAHPDRSIVGEKEKFVSIPQIMAGFEGQIGTYTFKLNDRQVIGTVQPFAQTGWVIVAVHDKALSYAPLYRMEWMLALLSCLVIALALLMVYQRVEKIIAPVVSLSAVTRQIAAGRDVADEPSIDTYRELHDLFADVMLMASAVRQRENDLQERNEELAATEEELRYQVDEYLKTCDDLNAEKVKLESILASMGEGLSIQDLDYRVVLQNDAHRALVGDARGKYCYEVYNHRGDICPDCPLKQAIEDGQTHVKLSRIEQNGEEVYVEVTAAPLRNSRHEIVGGIEVVRDVTSRIKADQEIRKLNQELEERVIERTAELEIANRELESFSYSVSHDLRAPLRHISSFCNILDSDYAEKLDEKGRYYISRVIAGCNKMGLLIDDLLDLSHVSSRELHLGKVELSRLAHSITTTLHESDPERRAEFTIEDGLLVFGDERLLEVMLTNLFSNAWKYTSTREESKIAFGRKLISARPTYFVRDNGVGFDNKYAENLFTPFHRLHGSEFEGTGIGLAIVQRIVHRHGGKIWAEAVEGEGATFYFTLKG